MKAYPCMKRYDEIIFSFYNQRGCHATIKTAKIHQNSEKINNVSGKKPTTFDAFLWIFDRFA
jgi:hypothetical protein